MGIVSQPIGPAPTHLALPALRPVTGSVALCVPPQPSAASSVWSHFQRDTMQAPPLARIVRT